MNNYVLLILGIWVICGVVSCVIKNASPMGAAFITTILIGFGYALLHRPPSY